MFAPFRRLPEASRLREDRSLLHPRPGCLFFWLRNVWDMTIEICSKYPDRGSQGILHTYKYCVSKGVEGWVGEEKKDKKDIETAAVTIKPEKKEITVADDTA